MNKGDRKGGLRGGFTIVETMIVLAVTGALFVAIAVTLNGRQNEAEFVHGIQDAQAQIQQVINQVSDGLYPSTNDFSCTTGGGHVMISGTVSNAQGTNSQCVFLGSVIQFGVKGSPSGPEDFNVYTIAGVLGQTSGATSPFQNVDPTVTATGNSVFADTTRALEYGITACWISVNNPPSSCGNNSIGAIGFLMEPGDVNFVNGNVSANPSVDLIPIPGTGLNQTQSNSIQAINSGLQDRNLTIDAPINPSNGVQICLVSGSSNQSGLITIGGSGRQLLVTLSIKGNGKCR